MLTLPVVVTSPKSMAMKTKITTKKLKYLDLVQLHLKLQKSLESKKVTEKGEYYFAKGFKHVVSCAKKNRSRLIQMLEPKGPGA